MSGFVVAARSSDLGDMAVADRIEPVVAAFRRKGMLVTRKTIHDAYVIYLFGNASFDPANAQTDDLYGRFCTYVGTLIYRGHTGGDATAAILNDIHQGLADCIDDAIGNFCLLIKDDKGLRIATDRAGLHHVYHDENLSLISNSFLAAATAFPHQTLQTQEILEYVQLGATFGPKSLVKEIQLLAPECEVWITGKNRRLISKKSVWDPDVVVQKRATLDERISHAIRACDEYYGQVALNFGHKTTAAISGGYDSRLNLGFMRRHEISPKLFVYGATHDADVQVAKLICESEGLDLSHVDRNDGPPLEPDEYWQNQDNVFHGLDALTQYGFACEPDEFSHRRERVAGGLLAINGGGGEIWRDFWKLPDKAMSATEFTRSYFGGRLGGLVGGEKSAGEFFLRLAHKVQAIVGTDDKPMPSAVVQSLYARFRLRFWQGKNNSVDNHVGLAVTPFSECKFSVPAMWIPMGAKRDGWFERQLIRQVAPELARYPSSYGYDFERGPALLSRMRTRLTCRVPTSLRAMRRSADRGHRHPYYHASRFVEARFGHKTLEVEKYVSLAELRDPLAFSRALTVERLLRGQWS